MADPLEAVREFFPDFDTKFSPHVKKLLSSKYMPDVGLEGKELVNKWPTMLKIHGAKLATFGTLAYFGLGTLNWGAEKVAPDGTPIGDAGLVGAGAYAIRKAHEAYARFSDITGLTSLRDYIEEKAPGMDGWQSTIGLTGAGALFGALYGNSMDLVSESSSAEKYKAFIASKQETEEFQGSLKKIFKEKYTKTGKATRVGALIGFAAALPFTLAGFGADSSASQLAAEYSGEKEVAVRKGRFWEMGCLTETESVIVKDFKKVSVKEVKENSLILTSEGPCPVEKVMTRDYSGDTYKIQTWCNYEKLELTPNHPVLTINGYVRAEDLTIDDWIYYPKKKIEKIASHIDVSEELKFPSILIDNRIYSTQTNWHTKKNQKSGKHSIPSVLEITPELGEFIGYFMAEGNINTNTKGINGIEFVCHHSELVYLEKINSICNNIFGITGTISFGQKNNKNYYRLRISSSILGKFIKSFLYDEKDKIITERFWLFGEDFIKGCLRGLFYGDGTLTSMRGKRSQFSIKTSREQFCLAIFNMLLRIIE
jgi:hypothetical protein